MRRQRLCYSSRRRGARPLVRVARGGMRVLILGTGRLGLLERRLRDAPARPDESGADAARAGARGTLPDSALSPSIVTMASP